MEREEEEEEGARHQKRKRSGEKEEDHGERRREVVMCVSTTETDDLPGERENRVRCVAEGCQRAIVTVVVVIIVVGGGDREEGEGECEEEPRDCKERGKRAPSTMRARRNEIFERRRTDVGRCFYERPTVCVDVNYIGGHEEQIAASSDANIRI